MSRKWLCKYYCDKWVKGGKVLDKNKKLELGNKGSKAIAKALMPRMAPDEKEKEYTTAIYKCVDWLEGLGFNCGQDSREWEMEKMRDDYSKSTLAAHKPLLEFF